MELTTFQHILEQRGLEGIAQRACQHHADKWTSFFRTGDHEAEFEQMIDLAIKVPTMRDIFSCDDVMMSAMLEAESKDQELKTKLKIVGKGQDEAVEDSKKKSRPKSDFNLGQAGIPISGAFWTRNLDKVFFYGQEEYMADDVDAPCDVDNAVHFKGVSLTFNQMQEWECPPGMCENVHLNTFCHIYVFRLHSVNVPTVR